ncbi:HET-domain-containing protein [Lophiostoma macrostomum CBS 122681]|uniref:HET-domain-containing protein n=1 Tax=Lophiostoma macrostomum CBS 122681 TaxID=1314788 RepID=A0A6A6TEI4_9PLEO|nr:HET-domain-containing protein [Lophiostoma macrostomum CBS 122681]
MAKCQICNGFEIGKGTTLPYSTWTELVLSSPCHYCQLLVEAINAVNGEILPDKQQSHRSAQNDTKFGRSINVEIQDHGIVYVRSYRNGRGRVEVRLEFFRSAHHGPQASSIGTSQLSLRGEIAARPGDPEMWDFLRSSLQTCLKEHSACINEQDPTWFPERLLSVRVCDGKPSIKIIETRHQRPQSAYIALSHCWGSTQFVSTTSENLQFHKHMIDSASLSRTFQDVITVAQRLDVSYIWIDSLCIIQDQEDDWARHAEQMDKIYENALFVVAAVSSPAGSVPFLGPDAPTNRQAYGAVDLTYTIKDEAGIDGPIVATKVRRLDPRISSRWVHGPLEERAWAMQERYCAVRAIFFTREEVKWHCRVGTGCECYGALQPANDKWRPPRQKDLSDDGGEVLKEWRDVVTMYSSRNLTYKTDRLPALAGIASRFHSSLQSKYVAGLWEVEIPFNLSWYRRDLTDSSADTPLIPPSMENGVPTWSWASNFGICDWLWKYPTDDYGKVQLESQVDIARINCVPSASNVFGALKPGSYIELHGRVVPAVMESDAYGCSSVQREGFHPQLVILDCKTRPIVDSDSLGNMRRDPSFDDLELDHGHVQDMASEVEQDTSTRNRGNVFCLLLYTGTFLGKSQACVLILGQVPDAEGMAYQRLGLGCGKLEGHYWSSLYDSRKTWALWKGWEDLEQWEEWERWFADSELHSAKIF